MEQVCYGEHEELQLSKNNDVERLILMTLLGVFALLAICLTAVSHPGAPEIAVCAVIVLVCGVGILWVHRRPVWEILLNAEGVVCSERKRGEERRMDWRAFTGACIVCRGRESYLVLMQGNKDSGEVIRAFQRCVLTGDCMEDGCLYAPVNSINHDSALAIVREQGGLGIIPGCVRVYAC